MNIFKKKQKAIPTTLNQTTRLYSLYGEDANLQFLESKIFALSNKVDNLPRPDLTQYAKKNEANTFTAEIKMLDKINMSGYKLYNIPEPTDNWDPTSKRYVDNKVSGVAKLSTANNWTAENTFNSGIQLGSHLKAGWGSGIFNITPEDRSNKTIKFSKQNFGRFNLDLENATKILNVPNPTANGDIVNKQYVDTQLQSAKTELNKTFVQKIDSRISDQLYSITNTSPGNTDFILWDIYSLGVNMNWDTLNNYPVGFYLLTFHFELELGVLRIPFEVSEEAGFGDTYIELVKNRKSIFLPTNGRPGSQAKPPIVLKWIKGTLIRV